MDSNDSCVVNSVSFVVLLIESTVELINLGNDEHRNDELFIGSLASAPNLVFQGSMSALPHFYLSQHKLGIYQ